MTNINWTQRTWNPILGCSKISPGCDNCYAISQSYRNAAMGRKLAEDGKNAGRLEYYDGLAQKVGDRLNWTGKLVFVPEALEIPLKTKKPTMWFVNSMSDLFHGGVEYEWIESIFKVMRLTPQHTYQVLTKRPLGATGYDFPPNMWLGTTVENQLMAIYRISFFANIPVNIRFLSIEPMLEAIDLKAIEGIDKIHWVILGGESGHGARECHLEWFDRVIKDCADLGIPVHVKQLGSNPLLNGDRLPTKGKGEDWGDYYFPDRFKIHQLPIGAKS